MPAEFAVGAYQDLTAAGAGLGLVNAGYYAIESLRLEKAYRAFGRELTPDYNPVEAGLLFACKLGKDIGFLGREAVERARAAGPLTRSVAVVGVLMAPLVVGANFLAAPVLPTVAIEVAPSQRAGAPPKVMIGNIITPSARPPAAALNCLTGSTAMP